jgi:hypothetical protein
VRTISVPFITNTIFIPPRNIDTNSILKKMISNATRALPIIFIISSAKNRNWCTESIVNIIPIDAFSACSIIDIKAIGNEDDWSNLASEGGFEDEAWVTRYTIPCAHVGNSA